LKLAAAAGVTIGILYTLSPLTVLGVAVLGALCWWTAKDLTARERRYFFTTLGFAVGLRLIAIAALFLLADPARPFATFFGDEELFKSRTMWLKNIGLGIPISPADMIYVYDDVGQSSYLYVLAYVQALVGDAPYGNNVFNATLYVAAAIILYRFVRRSFGGAVALGGFVLLLLLPSLFIWSISVLKEPLYILIAAIQLIAAAKIVNGGTWLRRGCALVVVAVCASVLGSLRTGGDVLAIAGTSAGIGAAFIFKRPWLAVGTMAAAPFVVAAALSVPKVHDRAMAEVQRAAFLHWGHVATPGNVYRLLEPRFYVAYDRTSVFTMTDIEALRFSMRAIAAFFVVPLPWQVESTATLAYLPEQVLWYLLVLCAPFGVLAGWRRDPLLTSLLVAHAIVIIAMVALSGGNIGTLIRHRGLALPYLAWLSSLGAIDLLRRVAAGAEARNPRPFLTENLHGHS
jgi:hypothetical protein